MNPYANYPKESHINWKKIPEELACEVDQYLSVKEIAFLSNNLDFVRDSQHCIKVLKPDESESDKIYHVPLNLISKFTNIEKTENVLLDITNYQEVYILDQLPKIKEFNFAIKSNGFDSSMANILILLLNKLFSRKSGIFRIGVFHDIENNLNKNTFEVDHNLILIDAIIIDHDNGRLFILRPDIISNLIPNLPNLVSKLTAWTLMPFNNFIFPQEDIVVLSSESRRFLKNFNLNCDIQLTKSGICKSDILKYIIEMYCELSKQSDFELDPLIKGWFDDTKGENIEELIDIMILGPENFEVDDLLDFYWFPQITNQLIDRLDYEADTIYFEWQNMFR